MSQTNAFMLMPDKTSEEAFMSAFKTAFKHPKNLYRCLFPHLTITLAVINRTRYDSFIPRLEDFFANLSPIHIRDTQVVTSADEYIFLEFESEELTDLHKSFLDSFQDLLAEQYNPKYLHYPLSEYEFEKLHKYGYHRTLDSYTPHLTIAKFPERTLRDKLYEKIPHEFAIDLLFNLVTFEESDTNNLETDIPSTILWQTKLK